MTLPSVGLLPDDTAIDPLLEHTSRIALLGVSRALASVGRAFVCLDSSFRIVHASYLLDGLLGTGTSDLLPGRKIEELLGVDLFGPVGPLREALLNGQMARYAAVWRQRAAAGLYNHRARAS